MQMVQGCARINFGKDTAKTNKQKKKKTNNNLFPFSFDTKKITTISSLVQYQLNNHHD